MEVIAPTAVEGKNELNENSAGQEGGRGREFKQVEHYVDHLYVALMIVLRNHHLINLW